ncbi:glycosyltransferase [Plantibacter sp. CFBP 8775]|uniref:glycosyltransferase n=1 Tax=Plantibacter sp. CFBP 8775 TaxID=2774038 RepID=UPI00178585A3|nr:glycosyltransferase [Plantibacter sp. CFBP 8775]
MQLRVSVDVLGRCERCGDTTLQPTAGVARPSIEPQISVCIPTHNPDIAYLGELFESIEAVGDPRLEVVISDDASGNVPEIQALLANANFPWQAWWSSKALGMSQNWNEAVARARGEFVILPGQDDRLDAAGMAHALAVAERTGADLIFGAQRFIDEAGGSRRNPIASAWGESKLGFIDDVVPADTVVRMALLHGNVFGDPCSTILRAEALRSVGGFSTVYEHAVDLEMWVRLAAAGSVVARCSDPIGFHRVHSVAASITHVRSGAAQRDRLRLLNDYGVVLDDGDWNGAIARLHTHRIFDLLRRGTRPAPIPAMEGSVEQRLRAVIQDVWQHLSGRLRRLRASRS